MVERSDVESRDVNHLAINMGNYKTSSMPQEQEVAVKLDGSQFLIQYQILGIVIKVRNWFMVDSGSARLLAWDTYYNRFDMPIIHKGSLVYELRRKIIDLISCERVPKICSQYNVCSVVGRILFLVYTAGASLPYYQAMEKFTAHSQHVNKESIDKGVPIEGMLFACKIVDVDLDEPIRMLFDPRGKKLEMCGNVVSCFDRYMVKCEKLTAHVYSFREVQYHKLLSTTKFKCNRLHDVEARMQKSKANITALGKEIVATLTVARVQQERLTLHKLVAMIEGERNYLKVVDILNGIEQGVTSNSLMLEESSQQANLHASNLRDGVSAVGFQNIQAKRAWGHICARRLGFFADEIGDCVGFLASKDANKLKAHKIEMEPSISKKLQTEGVQKVGAKSVSPFLQAKEISGGYGIISSSRIELQNVETAEGLKRARGRLMLGNSDAAAEEALDSKEKDNVGDIDSSSVNAASTLVISSLCLAVGSGVSTGNGSLLSAAKGNTTVTDIKGLRTGQAGTLLV
ncbi:hypothetical protein V6N11_081870 [Hibiscus sabdariffa]|uniref:Uncharacterized protein n=1 Tax=Hibiscus sabdariffa TaxID=183260 RepID=A0ABR2Q7F8_9ROSI